MRGKYAARSVQRDLENLRAVYQRDMRMAAEREAYLTGEMKRLQIELQQLRGNLTVEAQRASELRIRELQEQHAFTLRQVRDGYEARFRELAFFLSEQDSESEFKATPQGHKRLAKLLGTEDDYYSGYGNRKARRTMKHHNLERHESIVNMAASRGHALPTPQSVERAEAEASG